jgi:rod shape-determining protein MreC
MQRIAFLEQQSLVYQKELEVLTDLIRFREIKFSTDTSTIYQFIPAQVVHNQVTGMKNYITLNKGTLDGVEKDMGVSTSKGIVGVVMKASPHFSIVIPLLNSQYQPSCKIKGNNYFGPLVWNGKDSRYSYLEKLPRHATYNIGDTIVTSGFSYVFPEGVAVGTIESSAAWKNDDYISLKIKLFNDFATLNEVLVIVNTRKDERQAIEKGVFE